MRDSVRMLIEKTQLICTMCSHIWLNSMNARTNRTKSDGLWYDFPSRIMSFVCLLVSQLYAFIPFYEKGKMSQLIFYCRMIIDIYFGLY